MKSISFVNFKGGVTKTTSAVGLGSALAHKGKRVLIIDCDPQGHVSIHLGIDREALKHGVDDVLESRSSSVAEIIVTTAQENLFVAPSRRKLLHARNSLAVRANRDAVLSKAMRGLDDHFDYVLIDSPPDEGILAINAMYAAQFIVIPVILDSLSLDGINPLLDSILALKEAYEDRSLDILGVLINRYDRRLLTENARNLEILNAAFGGDGLMFNTRIRVDEDIRKAQAEGKTIFGFNPHSKGAEDFTALADEILDKLREI